MGKNLQRIYKISDAEWKDVRYHIDYRRIIDNCGVFMFNAFMDLLYYGDVAGVKDKQKNLKMIYDFSDEEWEKVVKQINFKDIHDDCSYFAYNAFVALLLNGDIAV